MCNCGSGTSSPRAHLTTSPSVTTTTSSRVSRVSAGGQPRKEVRTFGTMTDELHQLSGWLSEQGVTYVAMESTGSWWKPIFNVLEESFELLLVNAQHLKAVPGRKTATDWLSIYWSRG